MNFFIYLKVFSTFALILMEYCVTVSTRDFGSLSPGSNPGVPTLNDIYYEDKEVSALV